MRIPRRKPIYPFGDNDALYFGTSYDVGIYWDGTYLVFDPVAAGHENILFQFAAGISTIYGGANTSDDLKLMANPVDAQSYIIVYGKGLIFSDAYNFHQWAHAGTICMKLDYAANVTTVEGGSVAGDNLKLKANTTDAYPYITLAGDGDILAYAKDAFYIYDSGTMCFGFAEIGTDDKITGYTANNDLFLDPNGTGVVKFGVRTATGDVVSNGHITIKDAAGNTVKLMTTA